MGMNEDLQRQLMQDLLIESFEGLERFDQYLLDLEKGEGGAETLSRPRGRRTSCAAPARREATIALEPRKECLVKSRLLPVARREKFPYLTSSLAAVMKKRPGPVSPGRFALPDATPTSCSDRPAARLRPSARSGASRVRS